MKEKTEIFPNFLEGVALTWHEALPEETKSDWESLIGAMKDRFGIVESPNSLLLQLDQISQKEGESVSTFAMRYEDLFIKYQQAALHVVSSSSSSAGDPKGSLAMEHLKMSKFIYTLDSSLRGKVLSKNPSNFKEALRIALKKEASLQIESTFQPSTDVSTPPPRVEVASTSKVSAPSLDHNIAHLMAEFTDLKLHLVNARPPKAP